jgi:sporulation protein YlmC with PRC-barrel domain
MSEKFYKREDLIGKLVVDQEARVLGEVEDLAITENSEVGISVKSDEGDEKMLKLDRIKKIGDVVLLTSEKGAEKKPEAKPSKPKPEPEEEEETNKCPSCGWDNLPGTNFCVKCGSKLN